MNLDQNITAWFLDAATRHPSIQHVPDDPDRKHFFELEWDEMVQNGQQLSMTGWNLILEDYEENFRDNDADYISVLPYISFMILTNVEVGNAPAKLQAFQDARTIAIGIVDKMKSDERNYCDPNLPPGVKAPRLADLSSLRIIRVQPPFFLNACGVRVSIRWRTDDNIEFPGDLVEWPDLDEES